MLFFTMHVAQTPCTLFYLFLKKAKWKKSIFYAVDDDEARASHVNSFDFCCPFNLDFKKFFPQIFIKLVDESFFYFFFSIIIFIFSWLVRFFIRRQKLLAHKRSCWIKQVPSFDDWTQFFLKLFLVHLIIWFLFAWWLWYRVHVALL